VVQRVEAVSKSCDVSVLRAGCRVGVGEAKSREEQQGGVDSKGK
jgi:hypothetical protein